MRWFIVLWLLAGCSGYRFTQQDNPLSQYGIQSLSIPMFYNYSNFNGVSGEFTQETYRLLSGFSGLKLHSGYRNSDDAILIGIIKSPEKSFEAMRPVNLSEAKSRAKNAVGGDKARPNFYVPSTTEMGLALQVIVIKKPTEEELALLRSGIGDQIKGSPRVVFNELIQLRQQFNREILDDEVTVDANGNNIVGVRGTNVIATQNFGVERKTLKDLSIQAATSIRDMILYAF
jgi:hypothetical protein